MQDRGMSERLYRRCDYKGREVEVTDVGVAAVGFEGASK